LKVALTEREKAFVLELSALSRKHGVTLISLPEGLAAVEVPWSEVSGLSGYGMQDYEVRTLAWFKSADKVLTP
jgi:hypothetical protein